MLHAKNDRLDRRSTSTIKPRHAGGRDFVHHARDCFPESPLSFHAYLDQERREAVGSQVRSTSPQLGCLIESQRPLQGLLRVPCYEPGGRGFESCRARHSTQRVRPSSPSPFCFGRGDFLGTFLPNEHRKRFVETVSLISDQFQSISDFNDLSHRIVCRHTATVVP